MLQSKQHISDIASILVHLGISGVVVSPGSRNAPLIRAFIQQNAKLYSIVDERSAAYFALGLALKSKKPTVLVCTSGTAVLNYAPAVAEAFYQQVPLIVLTADRPPEAIHQNENQTICQEGIYGNNCKKTFNLPCETGSTKAWDESVKIINEAYQLCITGSKGPIHINVPLGEPLYNVLPKPADISNLIFEADKRLPQEDIDNKVLKNNPSVLVVVGQHEKNTNLQLAVTKFLKKNIVVYAESISNLKGEGVITNGDFINEALPIPDIVIFAGGQVVSKKMNTWLRSLKDTRFVQFSYSGRIKQPFGQECTVIKGELSKSTVLREIKTNNDFKSAWYAAYKNWRQKRNNQINEIPFSDVYTAWQISKILPEESVLFLGNSSVIRNMQLFDLSVYEIFSNRGTSGIDGCLSTAVGIANATTRKVFVLLGDISFLYDSNGLWNNHLPGNLKIVVINNGGGEIFKLINEPSAIEDILPYQETKHKIDIAKLCSVYGVGYFEAKSEIGQSEVFKRFCKDMQIPALLEINTKQEENDLIFKNFIKKL